MNERTGEDEPKNETHIFLRLQIRIICTQVTEILSSFSANHCD